MSYQKTKEEVIQNIFDETSPDQQTAIKHINGHARLLAGPGTGKTHVLTRKVLWLVLKQEIEPRDILTLTFTRLAAAQLRNHLTEFLTPHEIETPVVSTLHSFALRQILYNSGNVEELPRPVRIADDWEEKEIIRKDLKKILDVRLIKKVKELIDRLSADWETLEAEGTGWEDSFPDPRFLSALRQHKTVYGETLRAELVYKLKRALDQNSEFRLDNNYKYILIDEYQDLNACDLAVIKSLSQKGYIFAVGDDDQSIYGFRHAHPVGIRQFLQDYDNAQSLSLTICYRCDKSILRQAEFVADQDIKRLQKKTKPINDAEDGEVTLTECPNQAKEAEVVATKIRKLIDEGLSPEKIVILSRNKKILKPIKEHLIGQEIKISSSDDNLSNTNEFRKVVSILRLLANRNDALAYRTLIQIEKNDLGDKCINSLWEYCTTKSVRLNIALEHVRNDPSVLGKFGEKINRFLNELDKRLSKLEGFEILEETIDNTLRVCITGESERMKMSEYLKRIAYETGTDDIEGLIKSINISSNLTEQEISQKTVSVLTMHQAKGLTFDVCFIVGVEDEFIPGKNNTDSKENDERRLLYVSMTRAKHKLYMSYCTRRTGDQKYIGHPRQTNQESRKLTRFLADAKIQKNRVS